MRRVILVVLMAVAWLSPMEAALAQDGASVLTIARVKNQRAELAGAFVRVENVTISGFSSSHGGMVNDATGGAAISDIGMPLQTVVHLERYCGRAGGGSARAECHGSLEFTVAAGGRFTISDAQFIPGS